MKNYRVPHVVTVHVGSFKMVEHTVTGEISKVLLELKSKMISLFGDEEVKKYIALSTKVMGCLTGEFKCKEKDIIRTLDNMAISVRPMMPYEYTNKFIFITGQGHTRWIAYESINLPALKEKLTSEPYNWSDYDFNTLMIALADKRNLVNIYKLVDNGDYLKDIHLITFSPEYMKLNPFLYSDKTPHVLAWEAFHKYVEGKKKC